MFTQVQEEGDKFSVVTSRDHDVFVGEIEGRGQGGDIGGNNFPAPVIDEGGPESLHQCDIS